MVDDDNNAAPDDDEEEEDAAVALHEVLGEGEEKGRRLPACWKHNREEDMWSRKKQQHFQKVEKEWRRKYMHIDICEHIIKQHPGTYAKRNKISHQCEFTPNSKSIINIPKPARQMKQMKQT